MVIKSILIAKNRSIGSFVKQPIKQNKVINKKLNLYRFCVYTMSNIHLEDFEYINTVTYPKL